MKQKRILLIASIGGHLTQLLQLETLFTNYNYHIVTERSIIAKQLKDRFPVSVLLQGGRNYPIRYLFKFLYNSWKSLAIFLIKRPDIIITTGAHTAVPMCYLAKLFRRKIIFIESFAKSTSPTLSGRLVYPISDLFIVQWESMKEVYPKAIYEGCVY
ncbi:Oligosaccharide biosynthesis protein Alg14 like [Amphibacillus marinus]|uniref:Oligosaccharide biosynthesis protein Alg14 like n=1 Tax=Amphibacillus marinus TaxID=872970 RepID=A0A1H8N462_9BACI|nr:PssD/Cps14F family polysaccharide biosynthesis glycosyltransferase [Amphibacillus marinus]SEO24289.1 Oligosaccharide biosynthesis protein Alg14 like [Amphibacillus marinus]